MNFKIIGIHHIEFTVSNLTRAKKFYEKNVGMDHVSFTVSTRNDLDKALLFFAKERISHGEIKKLSNNTFVIAFRDPDNIQLELSYRENSPIK